MSNGLTSHLRLLGDPSFQRLKAYIIENTGLAFFNKQEEDLARRLEKRIKAWDLKDCRTYLELLRSPDKAAQSEIDELVGDLTIGETYFFRHPEQFDALRSTVFPDIITRNQKNRRLCIWSAGCATGPEPYSIAILLKQNFCHQIDGWDIKIIGTDINRIFLADANKGIFQDWALRSVSAEIRESCFIRRGKFWEIKPAYKDWVSFEYHNLIKCPSPSLWNNPAGFDLILCRNVMIYFDTESNIQLIQQFYQALANGGWLVVGHAENSVHYFKAFRMVNVSNATVYQKQEGFQKGSISLIPIKIELPEPVFFTNPQHDTPAAISPSPPGGNAEPAKRVLPEPTPAEKGGATPENLRHTLTQICRLANAGELEKARTQCQALLKESKLAPGVHFYYALILDQMGENANAEHYLRKAIYLDRNFIPAHYHLGLLYQHNSNMPAAVKSFKNVLRIGANLDAGFSFEAWDGVKVSEIIHLAEIQLEILGAS